MVKLEKATFAGGCFWCMEPPFRKLKGVVSVFSGYTGGHTKNPTYKEICQGDTGHYEAIEVTYDPKKISYNVLLEIFWQQIDPTDDFGQFADKGWQYRTAIFYHNEKQKELAMMSKQELQKSGRLKKPIMTEIIKASIFYPAEEYHQQYYKKSPLHYKMYRMGSGRDAFLKDVWKT